MVRTCRKFPPNWENVTAIGSVIDNTRFLPFKTPIDLPSGLKISKSKQFTTRDLLWKLNESNIQLGIIINLNFTARYYDAAVFDLISPVKHIFCHPSAFTRREDLYRQFASVVDRFLENNESNDLKIGVHCSDGINRTGYFICRYLIERHHLDANDALDVFEKARGHTVHRSPCVQALYRAVVAERRNKDATLTEANGEDGRLSRKRKTDPDATKQEEIMQQLADLEQQFSSQPASVTIAVDESMAPSQLVVGPQAMPQKREITLAEPDDGEFIDGEVFEDDDDGDVSGEMSASKRRRMRRRKLNHKFNIMKSGNFHRIREVLNEEQ